MDSHCMASLRPPMTQPCTRTAGVYCTTKWALRTMTDVLRTELLPLNINVVTAVPGEGWASVPCPPPAPRSSPAGRVPLCVRPCAHSGTD